VTTKNDKAVEDEIFEELTPPDEVGSSEYQAVYELVQSTVEAANIGGDDPAEMVFGLLDELEDTVKFVRHDVHVAVTRFNERNPVNE